MQFSTLLVTGLMAVGAVASNPRQTQQANDTHPVPTVNDASSARIAGLDATQSKHARAILKEIRHTNLNGHAHHACLAVFATALQESQIYIYANRKVPESLKLPHDKIGKDLDSVGIFQQRVKFYPNVKADMDPARSAGQFLKVMKGVSNWEKKEVSHLCQAVQHAAAGNLYRDNIPQAKKICHAGGLREVASESGDTAKTGGPTKTDTERPSSPSETSKPVQETDTSEDAE